MIANRLPLIALLVGLAMALSINRASKSAVAARPLATSGESVQSGRPN